MKQRIVQAWINHFSDDHTSPVHMKERVIVSDVRKHLASMANANKAYVEAMSSNVKFLLVGNDKMEKDIQVAR